MDDCNDALEKTRAHAAIPDMREATTLRLLNDWSDKAEENALQGKRLDTDRL